MPPKATRTQAERLGFIRPSNGGEGRYLSRLYHSGKYEAVAVDEGARTQWWYRPLKSIDHDGEPD